MRKKILFSSIIFFFAFYPALVFAQDLKLPEPQGFVNDFANVLSSQEKNSLENRLSNFEKQTGNEIAVAIVPDLQETTVEDYAVRLFEQWKIGKKNKDNGVLFLVSMEERKVRIEVGFGLEGVIPDGLAGQILDREVLPDFRGGRYGDGIQKGIEALIAQIGGEYTLPPEPMKEPGGVGFMNLFGSLFFFFPLLFSWFASFLGRSKRAWPGGIFGGVTGGIIGYFIFGLSIFLLSSAVFFGVLGFFFDYLVSKNYAARKAKGLPTDFWHSGGGFWFGGRGGRGGGGFGGFGGGFSGGGGASRGW